MGGGRRVEHLGRGGSVGVDVGLRVEDLHDVDVARSSSPIGYVPTSCTPVTSSLPLRMSGRRSAGSRAPLARLDLASLRRCGHVVVVVTPGRARGRRVVVLVVVVAPGVVVWSWWSCPLGATCTSDDRSEAVAAPLLIAQVTTSVVPGVYCTTTRSSAGTPRLLGPSLPRSSSSRPAAATWSWSWAAAVVSGGAVVGGAVVGGAVVARSAVVGGRLRRRRLRSAAGWDRDHGRLRHAWWSWCSAASWW